MQNWEHAFGAHGRLIAQVLLTHGDLANRQRFLNARHALRALARAAVVPIINENDTVAVDEIKFGDNDMLAALVCNLVGADALVILTDVDGLHDRAPEAGGVRIPMVTDIETQALPVAGGVAAGRAGSGGMLSKVRAAQVCGRFGVPAVVVGGRRDDALRAALRGDDIGTLFVPARRLKSRKHWLAFGPRPAGRLEVDGGARRALIDSGRSLLPAGVVRVLGSFERGDIVALECENHEFARGLVAYSAAELGALAGKQSTDIEAILGYKYLDEVIHRDDLVLL